MEILELSQLIKGREISPVEIIQQTLQTIAEKNGVYHAYNTVCAEEALEAAAIAEKELMAGKERGPFHGIPFAVKDLIYTEGIRTTMGSEIFKDFIPSYDATVVTKLKAAGGIIIGKSHTHEFAYGPIGDRSYYGPCRNPHDPEKITGGSSGGTAAAIASQMAYAGIGTDTGGSIRIPASACGIVGMKPTFGTVSKYGIFDLAYTLDHPGPMTKEVEENALLLNVLAGYDPNDPYSLLRASEDYTRLLKEPVTGMTIGLPSFYFEQVDSEVGKAVERVIEHYEQLGVRVKKVEIPAIKEIIEAQGITIQAEAAGVHEKHIDEMSALIDEEVYERLMASRQVKGYEYVLAQQKRKRLIDEYNQVFEEVDVLLAPTLPILPTTIGQREVKIGQQTEPVRTALLRLTNPINYTGNPGISVPCGFSEDGLPFGFQLIGRHLEEAKLYQFAYAYEKHK